MIGRRRIEHDEFKSSKLIINGKDCSEFVEDICLKTEHLKLERKTDRQHFGAHPWIDGGLTRRGKLEFRVKDVDWYFRWLEEVKEIFESKHERLKIVLSGKKCEGDKVEDPDSTRRARIRVDRIEDS